MSKEDNNQSESKVVELGKKGINLVKNNWKITAVFLVVIIVLAWIFKEITKK